MFSRLLVGACASVLLAACGGGAETTNGTEPAEQTPQAVPPQDVTVTVTDKGVNFAGQIESEPIRVSVDNQSKAKELFVVFGRLNDGSKQDEVVKLLESGSEKVLQHLTVAGGVFVGPQFPGEATILFPEGTYVTTNPEAKGFKPAFFEVVPPAGDPVQEPESLGTITVGEYFFKAEEPLPAGDGVYKIENIGEQSHELIVSKEEKEVGFLLAPAPGGSMWASFGKPLKPGNYEFVCFFPDAESGKPHAKLGMKSEISVK